MLFVQPVEVVNLKTAPFDPRTLDVNIGRPFPLQNPFTVQTYGRKTAIAKHRERLRLALIEDKAMQVELSRCAAHVADGGKVRLMCFCKPKQCHGDAYVPIINRLAKGESFSQIAKSL